MVSGVAKAQEEEKRSSRATRKEDGRAEEAETGLSVRQRN